MIDIGFDFRTDAGGRDPDSHSPTLRSYHRLLWSKPLPGGELFDLSDTTRGVYLHHRSALGEFFLSSDAVMQTFIRWPALKPITDQLPESENEAFMTIGYTIGAMMVFPGNQVDRKWTINQARGCNRSIADRFDLTLECIRRHYSGRASPLASTLARYGDFFALFDDFRGYVSFFLLDDLVNDDLSVKFFMPFDDFAPPSVPNDVGVYKEYRRRSIEFIEARNRRITHLDLSRDCSTLAAAGPSISPPRMTTGGARTATSRTEPPDAPDGAARGPGGRPPEAAPDPGDAQDG